MLLNGSLCVIFISNYYYFKSASAQNSANLDCLLCPLFTVYLLGEHNM